MPGFPENGVCSDEELQEEMKNYAYTKIASTDDLLKLYSLSVVDAIVDNVENFECAIDFDFVKNYFGRDSVLKIIKEISDKYFNRVKIIPFLQLSMKDKMDFYEVENLMDSGVFKGICFRDILEAENVEFVKILSVKAKNANMETAICCKNVKSEEEFFELWSLIKPDWVANLPLEICTESGKEFLLKNDLLLKMSPDVFVEKDSDFMENARKFRELFDAGVKIKLCSGCLLYTNKSISNIASDLCNTGLFTKEEISTLF